MSSEPVLSMLELFVPLGCRIMRKSAAVHTLWNYVCIERMCADCGVGVADLALRFLTPLTCRACAGRVLARGA